MVNKRNVYMSAIGCIGMYKYYIEKRKQYCNKFSHVLFLLGNKTCKKYKI